MQSIFDIKSKKQGGIAINSQFPKRKNGYKITGAGFNQYQAQFFIDKPPNDVFEILLEEIHKFSEPLLVPDAVNMKFLATYYKVKPTGASSGKNSPVKLMRQ
mmetsp:Transcript_24103/g.23707  ORF Transcript_24103/g.23707 Transcript_24103/m.23707 type:complete len:102 (-) Transcript_24103:202-507(-)|eukprot:CAMPEP_0170550040 /NCGR_PEP_ID=MMETSP0211-20121228/8079_1 /TAXON_ID=311385 /ORGANISM="Pseudokeronopsis sp., Strain OXSARD2" /LENGTH=101 /DNA_ID=CAMNT_0010856307 /DNA_START=1062 /DNA_END=1367 /DNA_ORIENTATION=-